MVCAFEIFATVAGELLLETGSSPPEDAHDGVQKNIYVSNQEWEQEARDKCLEAILHEPGTFAENSFLHFPGLQGPHQSYSVNKFSHSPGNFTLKINQRKKSLISQR